MKIKVTITKEIEVKDELFNLNGCFPTVENKEELILAILKDTQANKIEAIRSVNDARFLGLFGF